ncbi:MAG: heat shock protein HspQ [bacterium]|nr:heat shock protein HspQ [bacterium]
MPKPEELPHILKLLDDDSEIVQQAVAEALAGYGSTLKWQLAALSEPPGPEQIEKIQQLLQGRKVIETVQPETEDTEGPVELEPRFVLGQLVRHRRYNYRGVIVHLDATCQADESWYLSNSSQPDKNQPWYHVLVHGSDQVTYAAQNSLRGDDSLERISHPYVPLFFDAFQNGRYTRNDRPWPGPGEE